MTDNMKGIVTDPDELRTAATELAAEADATWAQPDLTPFTTILAEEVTKLAAVTQIGPRRPSKTTLRQRIGDRLTVRLMTKYRREVRDEERGIRDPGQPSEALAAIERAVARSEFTPDERAQIRHALGIDVLAGIEGLEGDNR